MKNYESCFEKYLLRPLFKLKVFFASEKIYGSGVEKKRRNVDNVENVGKNFVKVDWLQKSRKNYCKSFVPQL
jgi:hypothetical protein